MDKYLDLSDQQIENLVKITDMANGPQLHLIKDTYKTIKSGASNQDFRNNVFHGLMSSEINFNYFKKWAGHLFLNTPNTIYVYELDNFESLIELKKEGNLEQLIKKSSFIFDYNAENISKIELIDISIDEQKNQLLFSFISPSVIMKNKGTAETVFNKELYYSYIWIDYNLQKLIVSIPPRPNLYSVNNVLIRKKDTDRIAEEFVNYFNTKISKLNFVEQHWIIPVLSEITNEYFHHNNPLIIKKVEEFSNNHLTKTIDQITESDERLKNDFTKIRLRKELINIVESELIFSYGYLENNSPFSIFLQEVDKGSTSYKANNGGDGFNFVDSRIIVKKMIENAQISALGLAFKYDNSSYTYKVSRSNYFFSLKRVSTATTEKEIVDHVLLELIKYKQRVETKHLPRETSEIK